MSHTPGPWTLDRSEKYYKPCIRYNGVIIAFLPDNSGGLVNDSDRDRAIANDTANACLLAAAPELLEALKKCRDWMYCSDNPQMFEAEYAVARTAIAKATGGAE